MKNIITHRCGWFDAYIDLVIPIVLFSNKISEFYTAMVLTFPADGSVLSESMLSVYDLSLLRKRLKNYQKIKNI